MSGSRWLIGFTAAVLASTATAQIHLMPDKARRDALAKEARIERMVMVPMRDGVRLASLIYVPKSASGPVPTIFWRSPYNFSEQMVPNPNYSDANLKFALDAVRHGYAFVMQNERGKFYSEGEWEILGHPRTDGHDALTWIAAQPWSNGKVGTVGCSSTAEWIMGLAAKKHPAHAAAVPMAAGAGIGRMGPYYEQGSFYRGGAIQGPMVAWLYGEQNMVRPQFPPNLSRDELIRVSRFYDLAPKMPDVRWTDALRHLPFRDALTAVGGPHGIFEEFADRRPDDPAWYRGGLYHDNEDFTVPALWVNSWYDASVAPNVELFNHVRRKATDARVRDNQYMIVGPTEHCHMYRLRDPHVIGERDMGTVDIGLDTIVWDFFDRFMKDAPNGFEKKQPRVQYFAMGENRWRTSDQWPPRGSQQRKLFLSSSKGANSLAGDGSLTLQSPPARTDSFVYDPQNPVITRGGNLCCFGDEAKPGAFDQRSIEAREDVLVYTSEPLTAPLEVSGPIDSVLYVSSDARDTDFTLKLVDVGPDGRAFNLDQSIQRVRYREGYDREVLMESGKVYPVRVGPLITSNVFQVGHRIRVEVSSSDFPRFERNLNTGSNNARETKPVVARNALHVGGESASHIILTVRE